MFKLLLAIILTLSSPNPAHESSEQHHARMVTVASAIEEAADGDREVAAFLVMTARRESEYRWTIHAGKCKPDECDGGKAGTLWQIQHGSWFARSEWLKLIGTDLKATTLAAKKAASIYRRGRRYCKSPQGAISLYATGRHCHWPEAKDRVREMHGYWKKLW